MSASSLSLLTRPVLALLTMGSLVPLSPLAAAQVRSQSLVVNPSGPTVSSVTLINADNGQPVSGYDPVQPGATLDLSRLPRNLNLRANTLGTVGSVRFGLDGRGTYRLERGAPFALCANNGSSYATCPSDVFSPGNHQISATPYLATDGSGVAGTGVQVNFTVVRQAGSSVAINSLTLIDADTERPVPGYDPIPAGARLRLSALPRHLNVRANVAPGVGSVRFTPQGGQTRWERGAPFSLCGDQPDRNTGRDNYYTCDPGVFSPGEHRVAITPLAVGSASQTGPTFTWTYTVER